ncbi:DUF393 domain-containing protein [Streptomyces sp. NPDC059740]|uniref:DUF393 domain-containing protein n=1 Tax=Streptomyces sp. NPDC059740 TaxID=3346926 RepID=UPI003663F805
MTGASAAPGRDASQVPALGLTVVHDPGSSVCTFLRGRLGAQAQLVPVRFVPAGSPEAVHRFPTLGQAAAPAEITVVGDGGQVYQGDAAWVAVLWALRGHRALAHRLSTPARAPLARAAVLAAVKGRETPSGTPRGRGGVHEGIGGWRYDRRSGWSYAPPARDSDVRRPTPDR